MGPEDPIFKAKRKGTKPGGSPEFVGTPAVLKKIFDLKR